MKTLGEIMKDLGFNPKSSPELQKAFVKHLIRVANDKSLKSREITKSDRLEVGQQLSFELGDDKKVS